MKKAVLFVIIVFSCIFFNQFISSEITGEIINSNITGKATSQEFGLSIFVQSIGGFPSLEITSPKNNTYLKNYSILLNYTLVNGDYVWYNIDNSNNITINSSVYINVSQGQHTINLYSNNSNGEVGSQLIFVANSSKFIVLFEEYKGLNKGNSINFFDYTYEEVQNLGEVILENTNYGKIKFNQPINVSDDRIYMDNVLDLDSNTQISSNSIYLNSTEIINFNKSATIWLYNLGFANPRILINGVVCPVYICTKESYSGGTLKFNVTHFTSYSAEETPSTPPSGGGGGGSTNEEDGEEVVEEKNETVYVSPNEIKLSLKQGQAISEKFYLKNDYKEEIEVVVEVQGINQFIKINETRFKLLSGETKALELNFTVGKNTPPENYVGKIVVRTSKGIYEAVIVLDVQSLESLFDVSLSLNDKYSNLFPGDSIIFKTTIFNLGETEEVNATIKYSIKDLNGKIIFEEEEIEKIQKYFEKEGKIKLPKNIPGGKYVLSVKVEYEGKIAVTSANFQVQVKRLPLIWKIIAPIFVLIMILIILWALGKKEVKGRKRKQEEGQDKLRYTE